MSTTTSSMRSLIVGVENYPEGLENKRPGTRQALREIEARLSEGGWETQLLLDGVSSMKGRSGLTQILDGVKWLSGATQGLLLLSGHVKEGRFYPEDVNQTFIQQTTLELAELMNALPQYVGVVLDGSLSREVTERRPWAIIGAEEEVSLDLFSAFGPTQFLHAFTVALNTWPVDQELTVRALFELYDGFDPPSTSYHHYSSLESVSLLTPIPLIKEVAETAQILPKKEKEQMTEQTTRSQSELRGGRFLSQGRFQLLRQLGEGGIGTVFLAKDTQLGQLRAVKLLKLPEQLTEEQRKHIRGRMIQSARAAQELSSLTHHVVQVYDIGVDDETEMPFMVMEYLEGITLNSRLSRSPALSLDQIFELGLTLCETLAIAHQNQVIHRDLKPENVMLIQRGDHELFIKLLDFDLVKVEAGEVQTQEGQILGTLEYMAPEQLRGQEVTPSADVYALGAILYECFSGVRANPGRNQRELVRLLLGDGAKPLEQVAPQLPDELCKLINRTLSLSSVERPQNAGELVKLLKALQEVKGSLSLMSVDEAQYSSDGLMTPDTLASIDQSGDELRKIEHLKTVQVSASDPITTKLASPDPVHLNEEETEGQSRSLPMFILIAIVVGSLVYLMASQGPEESSKQQNDEQITHQAATSTPVTTSTQISPLQSGQLPTPAATWEGVSVKPDSRNGVWYRVYQGQRFEDRLGRLVYDLHFRLREGDPPLEAWMEHAAVRQSLLANIPLNTLREAPGELLIPQSVYESQLTDLPKLGLQKKIARVLTLPSGLLVLSDIDRRCSQLKVGDLITDMSWRVKGKRSLNGSCKKSECFQAHERADRQRRVMPLSMTLTLIEPASEDIWIGRAPLEPTKVKRKCKL